MSMSVYLGVRLEIFVNGLNHLISSMQYITQTSYVVLPRIMELLFTFLLVVYGCCWPGFRTFGTARRRCGGYRLLDELLGLQIPAYVRLCVQGREWRSEYYIHQLLSFILTHPA